MPRTTFVRQLFGSKTEFFGALSWDHKCRMWNEPPCCSKLVWKCFKEKERPWLAQLWVKWMPLGLLTALSVCLMYSFPCEAFKYHLWICDLKHRILKSSICSLLPAYERKWGMCTRTWAIVPSLMLLTTSWLDKSILSFTPGYEGYQKKRSPW